MSYAFEKYNLECQEIFLEFKTLLYKETNLSEHNKKLELNDRDIFNDLCEKIQSDLLGKMSQYPAESQNLLSMYARYYTARFIILADLTLTI